MSRILRLGRASVGALAATTVLALAVAPAASAAALQPGCSQDGSTVTCTYTEGSNLFTVPDGVSQIHVVAVGGRGAASGDGTPGGAGARVAADLEVNPGSESYALVGGDAVDVLGGANGGGDSWLSGGGGGGASDVRAFENEAASRLLVAAGGGGAGTPMSSVSGGGGGDAKAPGADGDDLTLVGLGVATGGGGGGAGTEDTGGSGGPGGTGASNGSPGNPGSYGQGGNGTSAGGGGGGGGLWGGGSGGEGGEWFSRAGAGGGGGGSNLVPDGGTESIAGADEGPRVEISYQTTPAATVTFTSGPPPAGVVGEPYSFTFTATGDSSITYQVTDGALPPGLTLSSAGVLSGTPSSVGSYPFTVTATGSGGASASQPNTVTVTAEQPPPPPPPPVASADLSVHLSASPNPVKSGRQLTYAVVVSNAGPDTARPVRMTDVLPRAAQFESIAPGHGWSCKTPPVGTSGTLTCDAVAVAAGTSSTITFTVQVVSSGKSTITNTAEVSSEVSDPDAADNTASVTTSVQGRR